jgi:hypothetical protein
VQLSPADDDAVALDAVMPDDVDEHAPVRVIANAAHTRAGTLPSLICTP